LSIIADKIGEDRAGRLSSIVGGLRLVIPESLNEGNAPSCLANRIGHDLAVLLILHFPGSLLYVPTGRKTRKISVKTVATLTLRNMSANDIATRLKCSVRVIHTKRGEARSCGLLPPLNHADQCEVRK
jgi:hypothetical protein